MNICMTDEELKDVKKDERPSFLKEAREEREKLEKVRDEIKVQMEELKELRAEDILSGRAPQAKQTKKVEENPQEYLKRMTGIDLGKR